MVGGGGRTTTSSPVSVEDVGGRVGIEAEATTFTVSDAEPLTEVTTRARDAIAIPSSDVEIN